MGPLGQPGQLGEVVRPAAKIKCFQIESLLSFLERKVSDVINTNEMKLGEKLGPAEPWATLSKHLKEKSRECV